MGLRPILGVLILGPRSVVVKNRFCSVNGGVTKRKEEEGDLSEVR